MHPDQEDITHISALIVGPEGTPYEGGFFHFGTLSFFQFRLSFSLQRGLTRDALPARLPLAPAQG